MPVSHLSLCFAGSSSAVRTAVQATCLAPHRLQVFGLDDVLEADQTLSKGGHRLIRSAIAGDALLVEWSLERAPLIGLLCHEVRRATAGRRLVPVLALCSGSQEDILGAWATGVDDVLHLPLYPPLLRARILAQRRVARDVRRTTTQKLLRKLQRAHHVPAASPVPSPPVASLPDAATPLAATGPEAQAPDLPLSALDPGPSLTAATGDAGTTTTGQHLIDAVANELVLLDATHDVSRVGPLQLDRTAYRFFVGQEEVELTPKEFELLSYLMTRHGEVCSRDEILEHVWGLDFDTGTNMVDAYVYFLRKKLNGFGLRGMIQTVRGRGYRLEAPRTAAG